MSKLSSRLSLLFACLGHGYMHLFAAFFFVIVVTLEREWGLPYHELVELWTLGALLIGLAALPAGWLGDRWSVPGMMVVMFFGMGISAIFCGFAEDPSWLMVGLAGIGLFASIYHPVGIAWVVRTSDKARGRALGINGIFGGFGIASAGLVAGSLIDLWSWRAAFIVPGAVSLLTGAVLLVCMVLGLIQKEGEAAERHEAMAKSRRDMLRGYLLLVVAMFCVGIVFQATQAALPKLFDLRLRDLLGEGAFGVGALVALVYAVGGVMQVVGGHLADRYSVKVIYLTGLFLQVPALALIGGLAGAPLVAVATMAVFLNSAVLPSENMLLARYTPRHRRGLGFGFKFVVSFSTAPLAVEFASYVQERTGEFLWLFAALAALALAAVTSALMLPAAGEKAPAPLPAE